MVAEMLAAINRLAHYLEVDTTSQTVLRRLDDAQTSADAWVKTYCNWAIEAADYVEYHNANTTDVVLYSPRVTAITGLSAASMQYGVWIDADRVFPASTKLVADTDYRLIRDGNYGILRRLNCSLSSAWSWPGYSNFPYQSGVEILKASYRAGYEEDEIPDDLANAVITVAAAYYAQQTIAQQTAGAGGAVKSVRRGQSQVQFMTPNESSGSSTTTPQRGSDPFGVKAVLDKYRMAIIA